MMVWGYYSIEMSTLSIYQSIFFSFLASVFCILSTLIIQFNSSIWYIQNFCKIVPCPMGLQLNAPGYKN